MGGGGVPDAQFQVAGRETFDWVPRAAIAHVASPHRDAALCDDNATCSNGGTFALAAADTGALAADALVALKIYTSTENAYYYVEYRSRIDALKGGAYIYYSPIWKTSGSTGMYGQTQVKDARPSAEGGSADLSDAVLNVGETLVLDLDDIGAVVTVDAVDAAAATLTVSVSFVEPHSAYHEATRGVDGELDLGCDGDGAGPAVIASVADADASTVLRLTGIDRAASGTVGLQINCSSGYDAVTMYVFGEYPLAHVAYGASPAIGALASVDVDCSGTPECFDSAPDGSGAGHSWFGTGCGKFNDPYHATAGYGHYCGWYGACTVQPSCTHGFVPRVTPKLVSHLRADDDDFSSTDMCCGCGGGDYRAVYSKSLVDIELMNLERSDIVYDRFDGHAYVVIAERPETPSPTPAPMDGDDASSVDAGCPSTCFGYTCGSWTYHGYSCEDMTETYNCECGGCDECPVPSSTPTPLPTFSARPTFTLAPTLPLVTEVKVSNGAACNVASDGEYCGENRYHHCTDTAPDGAGAGAYEGFFGEGCGQFTAMPYYCGYYGV